MTIGQLVTPRFRLTRRLGRGGMGTVWAADDLDLGSQVAVKLLDPAYAKDERTVARFRQEAQRAARVRHPHITTVFAYGVTDQDEPFIVMELLDGETVGSRIKRCGALPFEDVEKIIGQTAKALAAAHRMGIVHRDIKPENLFIVDLDGEPFVKVVDFGIAKAMEVPPDLTTTNALIGTPAYMSPEQYTNPKQVDWRTDLWALGVVAYEVLTGTRPFYGDTLIALALGINRGHFRPPSTLRHDLPVEIDVWASKALAIDVEQRFISAKEMSDALMRILNPLFVGDRSSSIPPAAFNDGETVTIPLAGGRRITVKPPVVADDGFGSGATTEPDRRTPIPPTMVPVRRGDHKALPFPRERAPMLVLRTFDAPMAARIAVGVLPRLPTDQWFVFTEDDRVYFHRAATGNPVYEVVFESTSHGGKRIAEAWVAANKKTVQNTHQLTRLFDELFGNDPLNPPASMRFEAAAPGQRIWVHEGDLTTLGVDAIVNAADPSLLGGTGLDGAIHRAAGGGLLGECRALGGCRPGEAKLTKGWSLPVKHVIHTVGPVWNGGTADERSILAGCYANSLEIAASAGLRTIAFPSISTGAKGFPLDEAAYIAARTTLDFLAKRTSVALVIFCTYSAEHTAAARRGLAKAIGG